MKRVAGLVLLTSVVVLASGPGPVAPEPPRGDSGVRLAELIRNGHPAFAARADVDRPRRVYWGDEELNVKVTSEREGYLYLLYESAAGRLSCIFPNRHQKENRIAGRQPVVVPAPDAPFRLRVTPPYGRETIKAVVTLEPLPAGAFGVPTLTGCQVTPLTAAGVKSVARELARSPGQWAEHDVAFRTLPPGSLPAARKPWRVGLFIGINRYLDERVRRLTVCDRDVRKLAEAMREHCKLDRAICLVDEEATLENIRNKLEEIRASTLPGDVVFVYWSGHGARCADDFGDERDGLDEYLVPYDGRLDDLHTIRRTMLMDDTFGRWVQDLDGRRVVLILDTCHSGGQPTREKGLGQPDAQPAAPFGFLDLLDADRARAKDIGQRDTAVLCSAAADQIAHVHSQRRLSAMTCFLVDLLATAGGPVTLEQGFDYLSRQVPRYVAGEYPGSPQTPVLISDLSGDFCLRP